jgi:hypothetical protein
MLLDPRTLDRDQFKPDVVKRLFAEHRAGHRDHGNRIWRLLNLEAWQRTCIDGETIEDVAEMLSGAQKLSTEHLPAWGSTP